MMFKMNQLAVGLFLFLSSLFSCQQKGDFKSMNVDDFDNLRMRIYSVWMSVLWQSIRKDILQRQSISM